jgi:hypothetical protein
MTAKPATPPPADLLAHLAQERRPIRDRQIDSLVEARRTATASGRRVTQFWSFLEGSADSAARPKPPR